MPSLNLALRDKIREWLLLAGQFNSDDTPVVEKRTVADLAEDDVKIDALAMELEDIARSYIGHFKE